MPTSTPPPDVPVSQAAHAAPPRPVALKLLRFTLVLVAAASALLLLSDAFTTVNLSYFGLAIAGHYFLMYRITPSLYESAPAAAVWFVIFSIVLYVIVPRTVAYSVADRFTTLVLFGIHVSALGVLRGSAVAAVFYAALASLYALSLLIYASHFSESRASFVGVTGLLVLSVAFTVFELLKAHALPRPREWPAWGVRVILAAPRGLRSLTWIEWTGIGAIVLSLLSGWEKITGPQKAFVKALVIFYQEVVEAIPDAVLGALFEGLSWHYPPIATPIALVFAICLRAAKLHSERHERASLWRVIRLRILGYPSDRMFSARSIFWFTVIIDYLVVTSILSYFKVNPIRYFAGDSAASLKSILFVSVAGWVMGCIGAMWIKLADYPGIVGSIVRKAGVVVRLPFYGIPLLLLAPFVAWRILLVSLAIFGLILYLNWSIFVKP